jgi:methyl-accepting chemotaxis protein
VRDVSVSRNGLGRRLPMGKRVVLGLGGLLGLFAATMVVAILLIVNLRHGQTRLDERDVPYAGAVSQAALDAKGVANDQRGYLLSGDPAFIAEANGRAEDARRAFTAAEQAADNPDQLRVIRSAHTGFDTWMQAVHVEFATFQRGDQQAAVAASLGPDRELRKNYEQALTQAQSMADSSVRSASSSVAATSTRSVWILVAALLVALIIGVGVAYWLVRTIARPLFNLAALLTPELPA